MEPSKAETQWAVQVDVGGGEPWTSQPCATRELAATLLDGLKPDGEAWVAKREVLAGEWVRDDA